jgi:hypothetical protein
MVRRSFSEGGPRGLKNKNKNKKTGLRIKVEKSRTTIVAKI